MIWKVKTNSIILKKKVLSKRKERTHWPFY